MTPNALSKDLVDLMGRGAVSSDPSDLARYGGDALGAFRAFRATGRLDERAAAVVWPESAERVARVLKFATNNSVPVVPYGGGTGVMGGSHAVDSAIILNMSRMNRVVGVDAGSRMATFQPGVILEDAHRALTSEGLRLGHDPWSRPIATIGGAISTNGVGYTASAHGAMGDQVLGMSVALADGEIADTVSAPQSLFGHSLNNLFIGSEGALGVIAEATLQVFPRPENRRMICWDFDEFDAGFGAIDEMYAQGLRPTVMDYGDALLSLESGRRDTATLYLAFEGSKRSVDAAISDTAGICVAHGGRRGDQGEVERYWKTRHSSALRYKKDILESGDPAAARANRSARRMDYLHVSLPSGKVVEYRRRCENLLAEAKLSVGEWSVWGRPEFFSLLIVGDEESAASPESITGAVDEILRLALEMGGSMEYCHGVGLKLAHLVDAELGTAKPLARKIKRALDPANILNPGKMWGV